MFRHNKNINSKRNEHKNAKPKEGTYSLHPYATFTSSVMTRNSAKQVWGAALVMPHTLLAQGH